MRLKNMSDRKHMYVLLRNKIIGVDSVIPLCMQLHKDCNFTFTFILFEHGSFVAIKNDNIVLSDAINTIGELISLDTSKKSRIAVMYSILKMILNINYRNSFFMHSGGLNVKPLIYIAKFMSAKKIVFHERRTNGLRSGPYSAIDYPERFYSRRQTKYEYDKDNIGSPPILNGEILIGYDKLWNYFRHPQAVNAKRIIFNDSRNGSAWIDFIKNNSAGYIDNEINDNFPDQKNKNIIIVFVGRLQLTTSEYVKSFIQMISEISENIGDKFPVFIKPHIYSDLEFLKECIHEGVGNKKMEYVVTKLHPSVLASRATMSFFIGNSNVISEISNLKVPVIQCLYGFNDEDIYHKKSEKLSKVSEKTNFVMTKVGDLSAVIKELTSVDKPPVIYRKRKEKLDCSIFYNKNE
jgi:hypothetical protein